MNNEQVQINLEIALNQAFERINQLERELVIQKAIAETLLLENKTLKENNN